MPKVMGAGSKKVTGEGGIKNTLKRLVGGGGGEGHKVVYEDVEGLTVSLGVIYALLLPTAMELQSMGFDEGVQAKNFWLMMCTQKSFRTHVLTTLNAGAGMDWSFMMGGTTFNVKDIIGDATTKYWKWDGEGPEALYTCGANKEIATALRYVQESWEQWRTDTWALYFYETPLWSDHLSAMCSFSMCIFMGGLIGSLVLYISLSLSPGREDDSGRALERWNSVGFPMLGLNLLFLVVAVIVMLLAHDMHTESQDVFFLRSGRWAMYPKLALLLVLTPIIVLFIIGGMMAVCRAFRAVGSAAAEPEEAAAKPVEDKPAQEGVAVDVLEIKEGQTLQVQA